MNPSLLSADGPPELSRLSHVELITPDLDGSLEFFDSIIGLETIARESDVAYLRAWGDTDDHSLILREGNAGVGHIGWRARRPQDVERFADHLRALGHDVDWVDPDAEPAQGDAIRFRSPAGYLHEIFHEFDVRPAPSAPSMPTLSARAYDHGISPRRIDHVNLTMTAMNREADWAKEALGLRMRDYLTREDGSAYAAWLAASALHHEVGMGEAIDGAVRSFHHVAYFVDDPAEVIRAATLLTERGLRPQHIGRHAISQALSLYVVDPGSGHRLEIYSGGQMIFDHDYEAVEWPPEEYRQWWGAELPPELWTNSPA